MKTQSNAALAAKAIRNILKDKGITGKVRSRRSTHSAVIDIDVENLSPKKAKELSLAVAPYQCGSFNSTDDSYSFDNNNKSLPQVMHIYIQNNFNEEILSKAYEFCLLTMEEYADFDQNYENVKEQAPPCDSGASSIIGAMRQIAAGAHVDSEAFWDFANGCTAHLYTPFYFTITSTSHGIAA